MVLYQEKHIKSCKGDVEILAVEYIPSSEIRSIFVFHHGIAEHCGRYRSVFEHFANKGVAVFSYDMVGHGSSGGTRLYVDKLSDLVDQLKTVITLARTEVTAKTGGRTDIPLFVGGQSYGGLVATVLAHEEQASLSGLLLMSPALDVDKTLVLKIQAAMGGFLSAVLPKACIVPAVNPKFINRNPEEVQKYLKDPMIAHGPLPARTAFEAAKGFKWLQPRYKDFKLPIYAQHGSGDKVTSFNGTKAFVEGAASTDKTFKAIDGGYHELWFEDEGFALVEETAEWMVARSKGGGASKEQGAVGSGGSGGVEGSDGAAAAKL